jgi:hypothetical protein
MRGMLSGEDALVTDFGKWGRINTADIDPGGRILIDSLLPLHNANRDRLRFLSKRLAAMLLLEDEKPR